MTLLTEFHLVKPTVFPVVMCECERWTVKKAKHQELMLLNCGVGEDSWVLWTARRSNHSILKEINCEYSLDGLVLKLQSFGHLMQEPTHWKRPWCSERLRARVEGGIRELDGWMASLTGWTWVCKIVKDRKSCILQSMGLQKVRHNLATEQQLI